MANLTDFDYNQYLNYKKVLMEIREQEREDSERILSNTDETVADQIKYMIIYLFKIKREGQSQTAITTLTDKTQLINS